MKDAIDFVSSVQKNKDKVICCPEAIAYKNGWLTNQELENSANIMQEYS